MKKLFVLMLLGILLLAGCKKNNADSVNSISLDNLRFFLLKGESTRVGVTTDPANHALIWTSSNPEVASVNEAGFVTAVDYGTANIYVKAGDRISACKVYVIKVGDYDITYTIDSETLTEEALAEIEIVAEEWRIYYLASIGANIVTPEDAMDECIVKIIEYCNNNDTHWNGAKFYVTFECKSSVVLGFDSKKSMYFDGKQATPLQ